MTAAHRRGRTIACTLIISGVAAWVASAWISPGTITPGDMAGALLLASGITAQCMRSTVGGGK